MMSEAATLYQADNLRMKSYMHKATNSLVGMRCSADDSIYNIGIIGMPHQSPPALHLLKQLQSLLLHKRYMSGQFSTCRLCCKSSSNLILNCFTRCTSKGFIPAASATTAAAAATTPPAAAASHTPKGRHALQGRWHHLPSLSHDPAQLPCILAILHRLVAQCR